MARSDQRSPPNSSPGHSVVGLVRSKESGDAPSAVGVTPLLGSLTDLDVLRQGAADADGVIHTAFGLDFSEYEKLSREDVATIETFGEVYAGSDRPIIVTHGLGVLPVGETFTEEARPVIIADYPRASEQTAFALAERGVRASWAATCRTWSTAAEAWCEAIRCCCPTASLTITPPWTVEVDNLLQQMS